MSERFKVEVMIRPYSHITQPPVRVRKKELVVNSKYGPKSSDPRYENLVYSSEVGQEGQDLDGDDASPEVSGR